MSQPDSDSLAKAVAKGVELLEQGLDDYPKWSISMVQYFGGDIGQDLERIWTFARDEQQMRGKAPPLDQEGSRASRWTRSRVRLYLASGLVILFGVFSVFISHIGEVPRTNAAANAEGRLTTAEIDKLLELENGQPGTATRNVRLVSEMLSEYHSNHTYIGTETGANKDIFVCGDMASDVWNMVVTKHIRAKIQIGDIDKRITSPLEANHAWVMAEVTPGGWLALETTGGFIVKSDDNPNYYGGFSFATPKALKDYEMLLRDYRIAKLKQQDAFTRCHEAYSDYERSYNVAIRETDTGEQINLFKKLEAKTELLNGRQEVLEQRNSDVAQVVANLKALMVKEKNQPY